ncbi:MAG: hypothetical protein ACI9AX_000885, partial [Polaromonas sp.]
SANKQFPHSSESPLSALGVDRHERPKPDIRRSMSMLQCGPLNQTLAASARLASE